MVTVKQLILFICFGLVSIFYGYGQNDSLVLKNNDKLVGEIKRMQNGVLTIETDYSDSDFKVTWTEVIAIYSDREFLITLSNGDRLTSSLQSRDENSMVGLIINGVITSINISDVVYIKPVESSFVSRLDASLSLGLNFTKSNNLKQLTVRSTVGYTARYWQLLGAYDVVRSNQDNSEEIQRTDAYVQVSHFFKGDILAILRSELLANDEQKLDLRFTNRIGVGKYFVHTNSLYFGAIAGVGWNNERFDDELKTSRNSMEGFFSIELNMFDIKDFDLLSNFTAFPSFTESGRWRIDYKLDLKYDLPLDFFIKAGITYNFDNQPVEGGSKDDYVVHTTVGWEL